MLVKEGYQDPMNSMIEERLGTINHLMSEEGNPDVLEIS